MIRAQVIVRPRASIFDPQGDAVCRAIQHLGVSTVKQAHVGKCIELELEGNDLNKARVPAWRQFARDLLSNPVIEDYVLTLKGTEPLKVKAASKPTVKKAVKKVVSRPVAKKATAKPVKKTRGVKKTVRRAAVKKKKRPEPCAGLSFNFPRPIATRTFTTS